MEIKCKKAKEEEEKRRRRIEDVRRCPSALTSRSNCERGASPTSMPPPDDSELSEGEVIV